MSEGVTRTNVQSDKLLEPAQDKKRRAPRTSGRFWRLVVPDLREYGLRPSREHKGLAALKATTLDLIHVRERTRGLEKWCIAWQTHPGSGHAHLDILLVYAKRIKNVMTHYDYVVKHGHLTKYRTLNRVILEYNLKEDMRPLTNLDIRRQLLESRVRTDLYSMMQQAMLARPREFDCHAWLNAHDLYRAAIKTNMYKTIRGLRDRQQAICNEQLVARSGICPITRGLIESRLTHEQLAVYDSWSGYQTVIDHINQIPRWGAHRPHKTSNLLLVGRPNTGKTSLALAIERHVAVYYKQVSNWFPRYQPGVYAMMLWNEFTLAGIGYSKLLNLLEGTRMDLEYKGGSVLKTDNQLVYMTSNLSLSAHIRGRFRSAHLRRVANANLRARITEVAIPRSLDLFMLLKLIVPCT